jgi:hypothetical protein
MMTLKEWPLTFKASAVLAIVSLVLAILLGTVWCTYVNPFGYILLGLWALVPPLWFLFEFASEFPKGHKKPQGEVDRLKHLHDLSRNIWLAFVVVLAAIMGIKWPVE